MPDIFAGERNAIQGIFIGIVLTLLNQLTGCYVFLTYAVMIFAKIGTSVDPHTSTIILGIVQIAGTLFTTQLADKLGRKVLLNISLVGSVLGQLALVAFLYLDKIGFDVTLFSWVPVASTGFVIFIASVGIVPLLAICTVEMLPPKVSWKFNFHTLTIDLQIAIIQFSPQIRTFGITVSTVSSNVFAFTVTKSFPILSEIIEIHGCVAIMSVSSIVGIIFVIFAMDETRGTQLDAIGSSRKVDEELHNNV